MTQTEKSSHVDLNDQHGSFWMDFRDFIMCFDKICVAHVARTFEKEEKEEKNSNDDEEEEEEEEKRMCLNAQMTGSHGLGARSRARTQPHRFGFGLWGRDVSSQTRRRTRRNIVRSEFISSLWMCRFFLAAWCSSMCSSAKRENIT